MKQSNKTLLTFRSMALISSLLTLGSAQAHHVWLEQDGKQATLYFGEFGDNLREASPGRLDRFGKPRAQKVSGKGSEALDIVKTASGFVLSSMAAKGESLVAEDSAYPITDSKDGDKTFRRLYVPAARLISDSAKQDVRLTLDLIPTGKHDCSGIEVQAVYKGMPLPNVKVEVIAASGWTQTFSSDADGKLSVRMPWKGNYVLALKHADGAGERGGEKYDRANYVTSLTVTQPDGITPLPVPPAATPSKMN